MLNKAMIIGNLGADPETRYTASGTAITEIRVATSETWKDKQGEKQERTEWHRVTFFGRLAEIAGEYLRKGARVYVEGSIRTEKWQDRDGNDRYTTKIIGNEMKMLGGREDGGQRSAPKQQGFRDQPARTQDGDGFHDDDIPF